MNIKLMKVRLQYIGVMYIVYTGTHYVMVDNSDITFSAESELIEDFMNDELNYFRYDKWHEAKGENIVDEYDYHGEPLPVLKVTTLATRF